MTNDQKRIKIAKACGWKLFKANTEDNLYTFQKTSFVGKYWNLFIPPVGFIYSAYCISQLPDYPNDLNAMHEAEKVLNAEQQSEYARLIHEMVVSPRHWKHVNFDLIHSTSQQRADAFIATLNL